MGGVAIDLQADPSLVYGSVVNRVAMSDVEISDYGLAGSPEPVNDFETHAS